MKPTKEAIIKRCRKITF
jgi:replication factor C subunit 1